MGWTASAATLHCASLSSVTLASSYEPLQPAITRDSLSLHLEDVQYGRRRVIVRYRTDHPKGARTKSRTERVVDLHEPATLEALSHYVMDERPRDADSPIVFLIGGLGSRRYEPLSYAALIRLFQRHCEQTGIRVPWLTPHAL